MSDAVLTAWRDEIEGELQQVAGDLEGAQHEHVDAVAAASAARRDLAELMTRLGEIDQSPRLPLAQAIAHRLGKQQVAVRQLIGQVARTEGASESIRQRASDLRVALDQLNQLLPVEEPVI